MKKVLFVCLGNICRSPSAEAVFKKIVEDRGLVDEYFIDSAGTYGGHTGEPADSRMRKHAQRRGYNVTSLSRQVTSKDLQEFDIIVAMDNSNYRNLLNMANSEKQKKKIVKMTEFYSKSDYDEVPDPYYGGPQGFEIVLDLLEDSCNGLLDHLKRQN